MTNDDYILTGTIRGKKRYMTDELNEMIEKLTEAEGELKNSLVPFIRNMFRKFYEYRQVFTNVVGVMGELDCLCALATVSGDESGGPMCRPEVIPNKKGKLPVYEMKNLRHPCVQMIMKDSKARFVPNDVIVGSPPTILITGPNMGGKSTLLRQTCLAAILAQIGCFVPADSAKISIVDRVFTRLGASDRILENKSTFFVELEEAKAICDLATPHSLIIMDELGRGTSTFDGYSIAYAVLNYLSKRVRCRTLFTTHYHMLVEQYRDNPQDVGLYQMTSQLSTDSESEQEE